MGAAKKAAICLIGLAVVLAAGPMAATQDSEKETSAELVTRMRHAKKLFASLTKQMHDLADLLAKTDPDAARALREAVNQARRAMITDDMASVIARLRDGLANPALDKQEEVVADLRKVLDALRRGELNLDEQRKILKDLKEFLAKVNKLIQQERKLEQDSRYKAGVKAMDQRMRGLSQRLDAIVAEQKKLLAETLAAGKGDPNIRQLASLHDRVRKAIGDQERIERDVKTAPVERLPAAGVIQKRLGERTGKLAKDIAAAAGKKALREAMAKAGANPKALAAAKDNVAGAAGEMKQAGAALSKSEPSKARLPQQQALAQLRSAEKALKGAIDKMLRGARSGKLADTQKQIERKTEELAEAVKKAAADAGVEPDPKADNLGRAAEQMNKAARKLAGQNLDNAAGHQKRALRELEDKKYTLAQLHRRMKDKAARPLDDQKKDQDRVGQETDQLARQMKMAAEDKSGGNKSTAGQKSVGKASKAMGKASGQLGQGKAGQANQQQNQALDELRKAREQIEEEIAREEERLREEELARIDQMLERMLTAQKNISKETKRVGAKLAGIEKAGAAERRAAELKVAELSRGEGRLATDAERIIKMLRKEGSTFVFPAVLEEVRKDLTAVADRLAAKRCGPLTRGIQREIERSLEAMIDSIRKELAERKRKDGRNRGPGDGRGRGGKKPPLVPGVAELKMLRALQLQVNARIKVLDREKKLGALPAEQIRDEYKTLTDRQQRLKVLTEKMAAKISGKREIARKVD